MATISPTPVALPTSVTVPADGNAVTAASVNVPFQTLADGVAFLGSSLADINALTTVATPANGDVRHVIGYGWYVFQTAITTGLVPFAVPAVDFTPGRWVASAAHQTSLNRQLPVAGRVRGITNGGSGSTPAPDVINSTALNFIPIASADGIMSTSGIFASLRVNTGASTNYSFLVDINDVMIDGATLNTATLRFKPSGHAALPSRQPQFAIIRGTYSAGLGAVSNLLSTTNGFAVLAAASQAAYDAAQALVFTPNQNNVIDRTTYYYFAIITDEAGTNAGAAGLGILGSTYTAIELAFTSIPDARRT